MGEARSIIQSIRCRQTTASAVTKAAIEGIESGDKNINAVVVRDFERARVQAVIADQRVANGEQAPLLGLPMTVKESFNIAGLPTTWGFPEHADFVAQHDSVIVARLRKAGAIILGKTNVPQGLTDLQSTNPLYGTTHNPLLHEYSPGGSSGGSAAALAAGFVAAEVGSDIGGSIRTPAAFCGVWGLKPTHGIISQAGHSMPKTDGADSPLAVVGPMARSPDDLDLLLGVLADHPLPEPRQGDLSGLRIAVITTHPIAPLSSDVARTLADCVDHLVALDAVVDLSPVLPDFESMHRDYLRLLGMVMSRGAPLPGRSPTTLTTWFDTLDIQSRATRAWDAALSESYDMVLAPVFGTTAFPIDDSDLKNRVLQINDQAGSCSSQLAWAGLATYPGLPAVSFPAGKGNHGLPIGMQLIGRRFADREILRIAKYLTDNANISL